MSDPSGLISLRLTMSLDGYIADEEGGYDWTTPVASPTLDTAHQLPFDEFLDDVDLVVMGRRCYDQGQHRDYVALGKKVIVATSMRSGPNRGFRGSTSLAMASWKWSGPRDQGQRCFPLRRRGGIVPVLLGGGRPLFPGENPTLELRLTDYAVQQGKVRLVHERL